MQSSYTALVDKHPRLKFEQKFPLSKIAYFKIGGPAELFVKTRTRQELIALVRDCLKQQLKFTILGGASNVLISDQGVSGLVISPQHSQIKQFSHQEYLQLPDRATSFLLKSTLKTAKQSSNQLGKNSEHQNQLKSAQNQSNSQQQPQFLRVDSGIRTALLVSASVKRGLTGLEPFLGVPGRLGGAVFNNSHYQGSLIGNYILQVEVINSQGEVEWLPHSECEFDYDSSRFQQTHEVILRADFKLHPGDEQHSKQIIKDSTQHRAQTQPLSKPSSGCIFKNVKNSDQLRQEFPQYADQAYISAGFLIDQAGLKGETVGGVQVSHKHAAFIVNLNNGTASDVHQLLKIVQDRVYQRFGVKLETEVFWIE